MIKNLLLNPFLSIFLVCRVGKTTFLYVLRTQDKGYVYLAIGDSSEADGSARMLTWLEDNWEKIKVKNVKETGGVVYNCPPVNLSVILSDPQCKDGNARIKAVSD